MLRPMTLEFILFYMDRRILLSQHSQWRSCCCNLGSRLRLPSQPDHLCRRSSLLIHSGWDDYHRECCSLHGVQKLRPFDHSLQWQSQRTFSYSSCWNFSLSDTKSTFSVRTGKPVKSLPSCSSLFLVTQVYGKTSRFSNSPSKPYSPTTLLTSTLTSVNRLGSQEPSHRIPLT